jgi:hypothetical protein
VFRHRATNGYGRGAFCGRRSRSGSTGGARRRANAGMSSEMGVRTTHTERLRVPGQRQSSQGESGPKPRTSSRRRWQAGRKVLHQSASLRVKRGRDREREPVEWTGPVASWEREPQANPWLSTRDRWDEPPQGGGSHVSPGRPEKPLARRQLCPYRTPTQVGRGTSPQVNERTSVKELGKLTPYLRKKGCPGSFLALVRG